MPIDSNRWRVIRVENFDSYANLQNQHYELEEYRTVRTLGLMLLSSALACL